MRMNIRQMGGILKQARSMKKNVKKTQKKLYKTKFTGKSPQNLVRVVMTGDHHVVSVNYNPKVLNPKDPDTVADLTTSAINRANKKIYNMTEKDFGKYAHALNI